MEQEDYGRIVRNARIAKGWTRADLAFLYGHVFHDQSVSEATIRMWEDYNKVPGKPKRRQVLALLLDIPLAAIGLEPLAEIFTTMAQGKSIGVNKAAGLLQQYKHQHHATTVFNSVHKILTAIGAIHEEVPYATSTEQKKLLHLLADYQQFIAGLYRDQSNYAEALKYQDKSYAIARNLEDEQLMCLALWRRGLTRHEQGEYSLSISDFKAAQALKPHGTQLQGTLWMCLGHVQAAASTTKADQTEALRSFDQAAHFLDLPDNDMHFIRFNPEGYHLNRASALLGSQNHNLNSTSAAFVQLALVPDNQEHRRRYAYSSWLQAKAWFAEKELPMATQIASDALSVASEIKSVVNVHRINELHKALKAGPFGKSPEVAALGLNLQRFYHPELFA